VCRTAAPIVNLGDSAITETNGLGGFAMAASPAIVQYLGRTPADATGKQPAQARHHAGRKSRFHAAGAQFRRE
jgi:hypothetical protein